MTKEGIIILKNESEMLRVAEEELLCLEVEGNLVTCRMEAEQVFQCTMALSSVEEKLSEDFMRINRSCIVNANKIRKYNRVNKCVVLSDQSEYKVSARKIKEITSFFGC
ncbi:LytTR family DNA-binding domain-containing protein [Echinicola salinicaeni]|uniref:LytTR family DNA-binding domain-containing protein n=1 Tax=Echinicola salinicaeni TaxID=2762757 RepID=UPI0016474FB7|nr:LytTR family DNA-binding domain-containing protein [Echinicola salinicaeni]